MRSAGGWPSVSTNLQRYVQPPAPDRRTARLVAEIQGRALTQRAIDHARAELARERARDIKNVTQEALLAATEISVVETFCTDQNPQATGRLALIANGSALALAGIVNDLGRA